MITIVSGLPRSGTSMMMQMLAAGGMPILTDNVRQPDIDNPRGYLEWEPIARIHHQPELMDQAEGRAVKVISRLLPYLPTKHEYKVIFMLRDTQEMLDSQELMAQHRGITTIDREGFEAALRPAFEAHQDTTIRWLHAQSNISFRTLAFNCVFVDPYGCAETIMHFLRVQLHLTPMATAVDPSLYRNRQLTSQ